MNQCKRETIDSSVVGLSYAKEVCPGILPSGVIGVYSFGAATTDADVPSITGLYNEVRKHLRIDFQIAPAALGSYKARVNRTRGSVNNVGVKEFAGGDPNWIVSDASGAISQWDRVAAQTANQTLVFISDLTGEVIDGDVFTVEISDDNFATSLTIVLTVTIDGTGLLIWNEIPISSDGDTGAELTLQERSLRTRSRQNRKGSPINLESQVGYETEVTNSTFDDLIQGFLFAKSTQRISSSPVNGDTAVTITGSASGTLSVTDTSGFAVGDLIYITGLSEGSNGLKRITAVPTGTTLTVDVAVEASVAGATLHHVGFEGGTGDIGLIVTGAIVQLTTADFDFQAMNLRVGQWIYIGGTDASKRFDQGFGIARIEEIDELVLTLRQVRWKGIVTEPAAAKEIQVFVPDFVRNEDDPTLIVPQSYQFERLLGSDQIGIQSEYLIGESPNELTINYAAADSMTAEFAFIGLDSELRNGAEGIKSGTRVTAPKEDALNSADHVNEMIVYIHDDNRLTPDELVGGVEECSITINNNAAYRNRIGKLGAFSISNGNFDVSASIKAYFTTIEALKAIRENADVGFNAFSAFNNQGMIFDIPLMGISGQPDTSNESVELPLEGTAGQNENEYTMSFCKFHYLPNIAMPTS